MRILRDADKGARGFVIKVNPEEAIRLIKSLSVQMMKKGANTGREEFDTEDGEYFTIAVIQPKKEV
ncbi:hypothetical protein ES703_31953 [subsurface metagenome]